MDFEAEMERKDRLLDAFCKLELSERKDMKARRRKRPGLRYTRMFRGLATVTKRRINTIRLRRENGKSITLEVTGEICELLREGDHLMLTAGLRGDIWRLIFLEFITNEISPSDRLLNPEMDMPQVH